MRVGIFVDSIPESGGGFQQSFSTAIAFHRDGLGRHEPVFLTASKRTQQRLKEEGIEAVRYRGGLLSVLDRCAASPVGQALLRPLRAAGLHSLGRHLDALLDDLGIDVAVFNEAYGSVRRISGYPFIVTVWDLDHRDWPELPEARGRVFELREGVLQSILPRAIGVIANSAGGARRIADLYGVSPERIIQIPLMPSLAIREYAARRGAASVDTAMAKYRIPQPYIYYPAYYLPQKNHLYLLEALAALERGHGAIVHAVFSGGGPAESLETIRRQVRACGLEGRVHFLGWVPDGDVPSLYEGAIGLVMPSYCGPTNLPPLEAMLLGRRVICSDLPGCREWLGEAATYCNLSAPEELADRLHALMQLPRAASASHERPSLPSTPVVTDLVRFLDRQAYLRRRWTWPDHPTSRSTAH